MQAKHPYKEKKQFLELFFLSFWFYFFVFVLICLFLFYNYYLDMFLYSDEGRKGCRFGWVVKRGTSRSSWRKGSHNHNMVYKKIYFHWNQWDKKLPFSIWLDCLFIYPSSRQNRTLHLHASWLLKFSSLSTLSLNILFSFVYLDNQSLLQCIKHWMHYYLNAQVSSLCKFTCYNI